jgi:tellurite resistance protein TerC
VACGLGFAVVVLLWFGGQAFSEYLSGYVIEKSLSIDNVFVWAVIFSSFAIPARYQHRVLFWGIFGALVMRAVFIFAGAALLSRFHWVMYVFGAFLLLTGAKLLVQRDSEPHPERNPLFRWFTRLVPSTPALHGSHFTARVDGRLVATPLLLVLVLIEVTDLVFALDSIPAIFAVTRDPFIVFTSNIFAILGLRSMFFLLAGVMNRFTYLEIGLAFVLMFVGAKMAMVDLIKIPIAASLGVIAAILTASILVSWMRPPAQSPAQSSIGG